MKKIAQNKKSENIAEYILYMYQMEDLVRSYRFVMEDVRQYVVDHYPISEAEKADTLSWFSQMSSDMQTHGLEQSGHLPQTQAIVDKLAKIHWEILKTDKTYYGLFQKAMPHLIILSMAAAPKDPGHEVQICLHSIYGQLLARLHGLEIPASILEANERFGDLISYLVLVFHQREKERIHEN